jgi:hypothetical protein
MSEQALFAPKADNNPWRVDDMKATEERLQIALWYPFSVRSLIQIDGRWLEKAILFSPNERQVKEALAKALRKDVKEL